MNLTVPTVDANVSDFITGVYSLGGTYLGIAVGAAVILMIVKRIVPWLKTALAGR